METANQNQTRKKDSEKKGLIFRERVNGGRTLYIQFTTSDPDVIASLSQKYDSDPSLTISKILNRFIKQGLANGLRF